MYRRREPPPLPDLPRRCPFLPDSIEVLTLLVGVHRLPESLMPVGVELSVPRKMLERLTLEHYARVIGQIIEKALAADHVAAVYVGVFQLRLLCESMNGAVVFNPHLAEAAGWMNCRDGARLAGREV